MNTRTQVFSFSLLLFVLIIAYSVCCVAKESPILDWYDVASSDLIIVGTLHQKDARIFYKLNGSFKISVIKVLKGEYADKEATVRYAIITPFDRDWHKSFAQLNNKEVVVFANTGWDNDNNKFLIETNHRTIAVRPYSISLQDRIQYEVANQSRHSAAMDNSLKDFRNLNSEVLLAIDMIASSSQPEVDAGTAKLVTMGCSAVPSIILNMNDSRKFKSSHIRFENGKDSFEAFRTYGPKNVFEALAATLNAITGLSFEDIYNGGTIKEQKNEYHDWLLYLAHHLSPESDSRENLGLCTGFTMNSAN